MSNFFFFTILLTFVTYSNICSSTKLLLQCLNFPLEGSNLLNINSSIPSTSLSLWRHLLNSNPQPHSPGANYLTVGALSTHSREPALIPLDGDTTQEQNEQNKKKGILLSVKIWYYIQYKENKPKDMPYGLTIVWIWRKNLLTIPFLKLHSKLPFTVPQMFLNRL